MTESSYVGTPPKFKRAGDIVWQAQGALHRITLTHGTKSTGLVIYVEGVRGSDDYGVATLYETDRRTLAAVLLEGLDDE